MVSWLARSRPLKIKAPKPIKQSIPALKEKPWKPSDSTAIKTLSSKDSSVITWRSVDAEMKAYLRETGLDKIILNPTLLDPEDHEDRMRIGGAAISTRANYSNIRILTKVKEEAIKTPYQKHIAFTGLTLIRKRMNPRVKDEIIVVGYFEPNSDKVLYSEARAVKSFGGQLIEPRRISSVKEVERFIKDYYEAKVASLKIPNYPERSETDWNREGRRSNPSDKIDSRYITILSVLDAKHPTSWPELLASIPVRSDPYAMSSTEATWALDRLENRGIIKTTIEGILITYSKTIEELNAGLIPD
jgi:hypothetical protein